MTNDPPEIQSPGELCCFCGELADAPIDLTAGWTQDGQARLQSWPSHRSCLMQRLGQHTRVAGGPLYEL